MMGLPDCREVTRRLSRELDAPACLRRPLRVRMHLLMCAPCRRYERQARWLRGTLRRLTRRDSGRLPEERRERVRRALRREGGERDS